MKAAYKIITDTLLIILIALVAVIYVPKLVGIQPLQVLSGSMEPTYHVGSIVYVKSVDPALIQVGDAITFRMSADTMVTHRVVSKDETTQTLRTKGDANETEDGGSVSYNNVVGKAIISIPLLGYVAAFIGTTYGLIVMMALILLVLMLTFIPDMIGKSRVNKIAKNDAT